MIINKSKTKESFFFWGPCPKRPHMFPSVHGTELVQCTKLLGVMLQDNFTVDMHVDYILSLCSQRICLMKRLRNYGLALKYLHVHIVVHAITVSRTMCAIPAWGYFLSKELTGGLNVFLRCYLKLNMLVVCLIMRARIYFTKYAHLDIVCMLFYLL